MLLCHTRCYVTVRMLLTLVAVAGANFAVTTVWGQGTEPGLTTCQRTIEVTEPVNDQSLVILFDEPVRDTPVSVACATNLADGARLYVVFNQTSVEARVGASTTTVYYDIMEVGGDANITCSAMSLHAGNQYRGESVTVLVSSREPALHVFPPRFVLRHPAARVGGVLTLSYLPVLEMNVTAVCAVLDADIAMTLPSEAVCSVLVAAVADAANRDTTTPVTAFPVTAPFSPTQSSFTTSTAPATSDVPVTLNLTTDAGLGVYINGNKTIASLSFLPGSQSVTFTLTADAQEATSRRRASLSLFCCSPACPDCAVNRFNDTVVQVSVEVEISESYNATSLTEQINALRDSSGCICDLTAGVCDLLCCCDADCSAEDQQLVSTCAPSAATEQQTLSQSCSAVGSAAWSDWDHVLCVQTDNNPDNGVTFSSVSTADTSAEFRRSRTGRISAQTGAHASSIVTESSLNTGYYHGQVLLTGASPLTAAPTVFALPSSSGSNAGCFEHSPVQYLVDTRSHCTRLVSEAQCGPASPLDVRRLFMYSTTASSSSPQPAGSQACRSYPGLLKTPLDRTTLAPVCDVSVTTCVNDRISRPAQRLNDIALATLADLGQPSVENVSMAAECTATQQGLDPVYNATSNTCDNVLLGITYTLQWRARQVESVSMAATLGSVAVGSYVQQTFAVQFRSVPVAGEVCTPDAGVESLSGNPGYQRGMSLRLGQFDSTGTVLSDVSLTGLLTWNSARAAQSLCSQSSQQPVLFGMDQTSGCLLHVSAADIQQRCKSLREQVLSLQRSLVSATYAAKTGNAPFTYSASNWADIIPTSLDLNASSEAAAADLSPTTAAPTPASSNATNVTSSGNITQLNGVCRQVPSRLVTTVLYASVGRDTNLQPRYQIVAVSTDITAEDWLYPCPTGMCSDSSDDNLTHLFEIGSRVQFIQIPSNPTTLKKSDISFTQQDPCRYDTCTEHVFYPLTDFFWSSLAGQDKWFTAATTLLAVCGGTAVLILNAKWRPPTLAVTGGGIRR
ncbi:tectonic-2-like [Sycon ciliatum]|uniref:tectonic-2-like n=1 Tax=Sycon ciliatum TaxID=27933 RepID=UPI0031F6FDF8